MRTNFPIASVGGLSTVEVAHLAGVHKDTLLRWLRAGLVPEPSRDRRGWRVFSKKEAKAVTRFAKQETRPPLRAVREAAASYSHEAVAKLREIDWDFASAVTDYLTHGLHPYPAKFIPQIPNALIQELSSVGDTVLDIFCGSGTTLAEALLLKRNAIGIDANPLACLISRAKTLRLSEQDETALRALEMKLDATLAPMASGQMPLPLFGAPTLIERPASSQIDFWFESFVIEELALLKSLCRSLPTEPSRTLALTVLSSIIVTVSRQDSDTRYVRRAKNIASGDAVRRFKRALGIAIQNALKFSDATEPRFTCAVYQSDILEAPHFAPADLMVCSPPYPNAFSYHLYHMTRMLWLDMDQPTFKRVEIGSHRKYSRKGAGAATVETFRNELTRILRWLKGALKPGKFACFVIGDSILQGRVINNEKLLVETARREGYRWEGSIQRRLQASKKSFNPAIGKIKHEHIVLLQNE